jgi:AAA family ATP:ADP antiporter
MLKANNDFGKIRSILWPIHKHELKKLIPLIVMFFCVLFNFIILRDTKDTLVVTAAGGGAEVIPFLKLWGVLPAALLFMLLYTKLSNTLTKQSLFYVSLIPFLLFFILFALVLYPYKEYLHPNQFCDDLQSCLPQGLHGLIGAIRNWTFSLFYIFAELWGAVILSLLCWGFANDITKVSESKRFYAVIGILINFAGIASGYLMQWVSNARIKTSATIIDPWQLSLQYLMLATFLSSVVIMVVYWWTNKNLLTDTNPHAPNQVKKGKTTSKQTLKQSFQQILSSKYLGCIAILVMAYGLAINLVEVIWKHQLKLQYPDPNDYNIFMGKISQYSSIFTLFMMILCGSKILQKSNWKASASITPIILLVTGVIFFVMIIFKDDLTGIVAFWGTTPLMVSVIFGTMQSILTKSCKFSFFDPTKEIAYIPLTEKEKVQGKAAVEIIGGRLGKSGGSLIQQCMILWLGSLAATTPYVAIILLGIIATWMFAISSLSKQFIECVNQQTVKDDQHTTKSYEYYPPESDKQKASSKTDIEPLTAKPLA